MSVIAKPRRHSHTPPVENRVRPGPADGGPILIADWRQAVFIHFAIDPDALQPWLPFKLDLFGSEAYVSLVAFTMRRMRPARGGRLASWLFAPVVEQRFLNLRTYVHHEGRAGIYFIAEWISHGMCVPLGPLLYGLPYRWGRLTFEHATGVRPIRGVIRARAKRGVLSYQATAPGDLQSFTECVPGSLDEFLLERYVAFTWHGHSRRCFQVWHQPWRQVPVEAELRTDTLLTAEFPWWNATRLSRANYSPGVCNVGMGRPTFID